MGVKDPNKLLDDFWNTVNNPQKVSENVLADSDVQALSHNDVTIIQITRRQEAAPHLPQRQPETLVQTQPLG